MSGNLPERGRLVRYERAPAFKRVSIEFKFEFNRAFTRVIALKANEPSALPV
ncbi:MAG: hypothetical protein M3R11_05105 [Acidobacteriota bacterium]|nr:hypothetical protein [Acidobacteriota bacterium]